MQDCYETLLLDILSIVYFISHEYWYVLHVKLTWH